MLDRDAAGQLVKTLGGVPLAIQQARALIQQGIPTHTILKNYDSRYRELMGHKPDRTALNYDKNISIVTMFDMMSSKLVEDDHAASLLSLFSCFGPQIISLDLFHTFSQIKGIGADRELHDSSQSFTKLPWLLRIAGNQLALGFAISRLENLCLIKTKRDEQSAVSRILMHSSICKWRLETIEQLEREDFIILAAWILKENLPDVDMNAVPYLKYLPLIKYSGDMIQLYLKPTSLEPPDGRLCQQYAAIAIRYGHLYMRSPYTKKAQDMLTAAVNYESMSQGVSWPKDRWSLLLLDDLAISLWKYGYLDKAEEALHFLWQKSTDMFGTKDDFTVRTADRLRNVKDRRLFYDSSQQRAVIATNGTKLNPRLNEITSTETMRNTFVEHDSFTSDEEYTLAQAIEETKDVFGPDHDETIRAIEALALYHLRHDSYFKAGKSFEQLWGIRCSKGSVKRAATSLANATACYFLSDTFSEQLGVGSIGNGVVWAAQNRLYSNFAKNLSKIRPETEKIGADHPFHQQIRKYLDSQGIHILEKDGDWFFYPSANSKILRLSKATLIGSSIQ